MFARFTRKNFIFLGILFFALLFLLLGGVGIDSASPLGTNNILGSLASSIGFNRISGNYKDWFMLISFAAIAYVASVAIIYESRLAKYYDHRFWNWKWATRYLLTILGALILWGLLSMIAQIPFVELDIRHSFRFFGLSLGFGAILVLATGMVILSFFMIVVNFKNIDQPFKFFKRKNEEDPSYAEDAENEEVLDDIEKQGLSDLIRFGNDDINAQGGGGGGGAGGSGSGSGGPAGKGGAGGVGGGGGDGTLSSDYSIDYDKYIIFPGLVKIDDEELAYSHEPFGEEEYSLREIADNFRLYLAKEHALYYTIDTLRSFLAGLSVSRLMILEGLSGTGKSSLARYFSIYIGEEPFFESVQASWHDRTSLLGFYNDFLKKYNETEFLKKLYQMNFRLENINVMVLDEVNISRVEYYFADFLSILEYPMDEWKLKVMELPADFDGPIMMKDGFINIPHNTWFIGTANKDESTFAITDKVYDRAIIISFDDRNVPFAVEGDVHPIRLSYDKLNTLFEEARKNPENCLVQRDYEKFETITSFVYDTFDIAFGNRIWNQIVKFVPVYVEMGGTKEEALDFMLARKYLRKLSGRFEDFIKQGLIDLLGLLDRTYGENSFRESRHEIHSLLRKL